MKRNVKKINFVVSLFALTALILTSLIVSETGLVLTEASARHLGKDQVSNRSTSSAFGSAPNLSNLAYSTFLGGAAADEGREIAVDSAGNIYVAGVTSSAAFPTTVGAFDTSHNGGGDIFVAKFNPTASALIYSTFIGGSGAEEGLGLAVDSSGNAFVAGRTQSTNYPTTAGAFDTSANGGEEVFVTKLNPTGSALVYSTYLGGSGSDQSRALSIDVAGNAFIVGNTSSSSFPTTAGAFDTSINGSTDAFVTQLNAAGSALIYSTFLGGSSGETGLAIAVDTSGDAVVTGYTSPGTPNFPTTAGAFDETHNGSFDLYVTKLNSTGSALTYSTFIGGSGLEQVFDIALDAAGNAFITGETENGTYPTTPGAFDTTYGGSIRDAFVTKLNSTGSALTYSTFLGGSSVDQAYGIVLDPSGNAFITGRMESANYPTTAGAYDTTHNGSRDAVVTQLNAAGSALIYSTFIGAGTFVDEGLGIALDSSGNVFITGLTANTTFPTTAGAFDTTYNGAVDAIVAKLGDAVAPGDTPYDFDGDGRADVSVFRPSGGIWYLNRSTAGFGAAQWGISTDKLAPADYDGDGKTDIAVWRESEGNFYILNSSNNSVRVENFGLPGDVLTVGDWDGDGKADLSTYRDGPQSTFFYRGSLNNPNGNTTYGPWGTTGDKPMLGDFDGDGKQDAAVFRPSNNVWYIYQSSNNQIRYDFWGLSTDKFVTADYDGDAKTDLAVFRNGVWYIKQSSKGQPQYINFGLATDTLVPADYDGDGKTDVAVFRNGIWYLNQSTSGFAIANFGLGTDTAVPNAYIAP